MSSYNCVWMKAFSHSKPRAAGLAWKKRWMSKIAGALFLETYLVTDLGSLDGGSAAKLSPNLR